MSRQVDDTAEDSAAERPTLWRVSDFQRAMTEAAEASGLSLSAGLSSLSPTLMQEIESVDRIDDSADVLEVAASCLRHTQNVVLHLARDGYVLPITLFPRERLYHCPLPTDQLLDDRLARVRLLQVEPTLLCAPGSRHLERIAPRGCYHALGPLLWSMATLGPRTTLLPQIRGSAVYRTAPGVPLRSLSLRGAWARGVYHLKHEAVPLRVIENWAGFDHEKAVRLLNALYLQSGLMVSRTHPAALSAQTISQSWRQFLRRRREADEAV